MNERGALYAELCEATKKVHRAWWERECGKISQEIRDELELLTRPQRVGLKYMVKPLWFWEAP